MSDSKRYGLILSSKKQKPCGPIKRPAAFGDDSSSEGETDGRLAVNASLRKEATKTSVTKKTQDVLAKAITEDPSVFEYDSVYDKMQDDKRKSDPRLTAGKSTKPKYIAALKKTADRRKIEQDIIYERKVQREMEAESDQFGDKDAFVTSAYKMKLAERKIMEAELEKEAAIDAANDVTKQDNIGRFYQELLKQKVSLPSDVDVEVPVRDETQVHHRHGDEQPSDVHSDVVGEALTGEEAKRRSPDFVPSKQDALGGPSLSIEDSMIGGGMPVVPPAPASTCAQPEGANEDPFAKRTDQKALESARSRYLARQRAKQSH